ncbi:hypothetical protein P9C05_15090 [Bacillus paralicheniformis]|uniref:hypothetical protein n=1 Tax=Bacillus paralicheniformis TaxID=1648923 RepID=UPI002DBB1EED|nr:hypothetical protein [Bacillus paralicheniformis]MEC1034515.1 hypothetical protein [Bacillus paralicheniformis]MEC1059287.1 hypothetical protein [Bacillus paralicheniformis]MEC1187454.1 hypothetical protein [Bacillus paralicheniformis]
MLEKLKTLYGERMVVSEAVSKHDAIWFQTDEGETFGVLKSAVTDREKELLHCLFRPFSEPHPAQQLTKRETEWHEYFFRDVPLQNPGNIQLMQGHFFKMEHVPEERQAIKEAVSGFFKDPLVVWYDRHEAVIVHENPSPFLAKKRAVRACACTDKRFHGKPRVFQRPASSSQRIASR